MEDRQPNCRAQGKVPFGARVGSDTETRHADGNARRIIIMLMNDPCASANGNDPWATIPAGGEGRRVRSIVGGGSGTLEQFRSLAGEPSPSQRARDRSERFAPPRRILPVVDADHSRWWKADLPPFPAANVVVQPANRGTAGGVLLASAMERH
jgi:hypothetical protein